MPDFKEILDNLPEKPPRSRLEPYRELILEMRRRGRPLREIAQVLGEKFGVRVVSSTIHDFVNAASSRERKSEQKTLGRTRGSKLIPPGSPGNDPSPDEVERRIAALTQPSQLSWVSDEIRAGGWGRRFTLSETFPQALVVETYPL
jgi:hypothetical protein